MCNPCHWLPRATTLPVELSASTPVTEEKMKKNYDENDEDDDENYLHQLW